VFFSEHSVHKPNHRQSISFLAMDEVMWTSSNFLYEYLRIFDEFKKLPRNLTNCKTESHEFSNFVI